MDNVDRAPGCAQRVDSRDAGRASGRLAQPGVVAGLRPAHVRRADIIGLITIFDVSTWELDDLTVVGRRNVIRRIERACRNERQRGLANSFAYHPARHNAMLRVLKIERAELSQIEKGAPCQTSSS